MPKSPSLLPPATGGDADAGGDAVTGAGGSGDAGGGAEGSGSGSGDAGGGGSGSGGAEGGGDGGGNADAGAGDTTPLTRPQVTVANRQGRKQIRDLQIQADSLLMQRAIAALENNEIEKYELLRGKAQGDGDSTEHEKYLDRRRVWITGGLMVALFAIVGIVLFRTSITSTATPYVSLLSGLAGIALGWMFAGGGSTSKSGQTSGTRGGRGQPGPR